VMAILGRAPAHARNRARSFSVTIMSTITITK
jgi:hypothetical protein